MNFNWPKLTTEKANGVAVELQHLCIDLNSGSMSTEQKIRAFNDILGNALERRHYDTLTNNERKAEFGKLARIVQSIFSYFHNSEMYYKVRPEVFKSNMKFFSYSHK